VVGPPKGGSFLALGLGAVSLSDRCSGSELVCLSGYLWGWEGWFVLSLLFLYIFVLLLKYERCHINRF